jgi:putative transcriptional regulator
MIKKMKPRSGISEAVYDGYVGMYRLGHISAETLAKHTVNCLVPTATDLPPVAGMKPKNRVHEIIYAGVHSMYPRGLVTKDEMDWFTADCLEPVIEYDAKKVKALRKRLDVSQEELANNLDISVSTVRQWERGVKKPSGPSRKLLSIVERKGLEAVM